MARLSTAARKALPAKDFAGPHRTFPDEDKVHAEKALQLAPRSEKAGNISKGTEQRIEAKARTKLHAGNGRDVRPPQSHAEFEALGRD